MDIRDYLSDEGQVVLALCSSFAVPDGPAGGALEPFKLSEWKQMARKIDESPFQHPAALQGQTANELSKALGLAPDDAERIVALLERSGRLALELDALFSRGLWVMTRVDERYPAKLRNTLKHQAPTVLFGAGDWQLLAREGVAVVGSRNIDEPGTDFALMVGKKAAAAQLQVVSGGARGTDRLAMGAALEPGGKAVGVLADSLERTVRQPDLRQLLLDGQLVLVTPYAPTAGFSVGAAMGRNKVIYGLSDFAVVVSSDFQTGGTWAGAAEALKAHWCPVFVRAGESVPKGNRELVKRGAAPLTEAELPKIENLADWLRENAKRDLKEPDLFS